MTKHGPPGPQKPYGEQMTLTAQDACKMNREICALAPIVPVLVVNDASTARSLAEALVAGGLPALEVTLRTPAALDAIRAMSEVPGGVVGAGTLITPADVRAAKAAGAKFGVSPGATDSLIRACEDEGLPLLAGAATATEAMAMLEKGYDLLKFFPAEASGGAPALKAIGAPLPQISFCPTGGVSLSNAMDYLSLSNVVCAGGSWVAPADLVTAGDWAGIEALAREASLLGRE
jgi:2-dehydro-3-deoxyphosphogluconate aldolase/(4S)-4-hydroxy-2-oxoglutarate aldolase